jgi:PIN domain nuclease of toxin-antitoxin system
MIGAVTDTHALIWYLLDSPRLSVPALTQFEACRTAGFQVGVSSISIVEIIYLVEKGRIPAATLALLEKRLAARPTILSIVPLSHSIALSVEQVPRDQIPDLPDRIIAATALNQGVPLITRDRRIVVSSIETIW